MRHSQPPLPKCATHGCRYAVPFHQARFCTLCDPSGVPGSPAYSGFPQQQQQTPGSGAGAGAGAGAGGGAGRSGGQRPPSPLRGAGTPRGGTAAGTPQQHHARSQPSPAQQPQQQHQHQPLPRQQQQQPSAQKQPPQPLAPSNDFAVACGPLEAGAHPATEVVVGSLHADPLVPLCFNLQASGAFVRVRMPSGEVKSWELPLEVGRQGSGEGAASPAAAAAAAPRGGLFEGIFSALGGSGGSSSGGSGGGGGGGGGAAPSSRRPPTLPLRVEVSLSARTRRVVVRLGSTLEGGPVWLPALFFSHRYDASAAEAAELASLTGWSARVREVGASVDALCDQPRVVPLLALLGASRGALRFEVRRLAALRRGLLDEIKAVMAALSAASASSEGGEEGGGGEGAAGSGGSGGARSPAGAGAAAAAAAAARVTAELGKLRDDVGALTVRVSPVGEEGGGRGGEADAASISAGGAHEALAAAYREAFHNAQVCAGLAAGEEESEAGEEAGAARGRGFGLHVRLGGGEGGSGGGGAGAAALAALRAAAAALFAAARTAAREKAECLKAHFGATTPRSRIEGLARWVQDAVRCTGAALSGELAGIAIERSDGIPLLT